MVKFLFGFLFLAGVGTAFAAPFLTCNPFPANADTGQNIVKFIITFQAPAGLTPVSVQSQIGTSGQQYMFYDLSTLANSSYTVTAAAVNGYNLEGPQSDPFTFQKGVPAMITGLSIVPSIPSPLP